MNPTYMIQNWILFLLFFLLTSKSECQTDIPSAGLLCISECQTCPVICSSPPTPSFPPPSPPPHHQTPPPEPYYIDLPPPPHHQTPPPDPYYIDLPPPPKPMSHPPPSPPRYHPPLPPSTSDATTPPPSVYVYTSPNINLPPGMGQKNFSYPYYYFYTTSEASTLLDLHQCYINFLLFVLFQNVVAIIRFV